MPIWIAHVYCPPARVDAIVDLDGVSVTVNGKPAFVYYISPKQIDVLTPYSGGEQPTLHRLNGNEWQRVRSQARRACTSDGGVSREPFCSPGCSPMSSPFDNHC